MDRSFQSPFSTKSPFSPRARQSLNTSRRILQPAFRKSSRFSVSGKSVQSIQVIVKSQANYVEKFGQPLPVLITEALTFAERNAIVTAKISTCGYAWVVCGRRLLIWQYRQTIPTNITPQRKPVISNQCFELQLPQSDLAHRAELVSVFIGKSSSTPSCIAVSPEGVIRYWPAIAHENVTIEQLVDLQGQECDSLTDVEGLGCILATTTCTIVLVQPHFTSGRHNFTCKTLKMPGGWFGGIGKRMSSLFFGPINSEQSSETRLVRILSLSNNNGTWTVFVLAGHSIQKWLISQTGTEQLIYMAELNRLIRDNFMNRVWENCGGDQAEMDTWFLDLQLSQDKIVLLAAAVNMTLSSQVHYAFAWIDVNADPTPIKFDDFQLLKRNGFYRDENPAESLGYRFLLSGSYAYLYNQRTITVIKPHEEPDTLEFTAPQDFILGGSICVNTPIFFCRNNGLVAVSSNELGSDLTSLNLTSNTAIETSFNESIVTNNLSVYNMDPEEICSSYKDTLSQLKAAFIFHLKNQPANRQEILNEIFPLEGANVPSVDGIVDKVVVNTCNDLLDDIPAGDPRWNKDSPYGIGSSYSMQVLYQLEDKQKAISLFVSFLKQSGLWKKLAAYTIHDVIMTTVHVLAELSEKIVAAIVLKSLPNSEILEKAIEKSLSTYQIQPDSILTNQDIFYREVSKVHRGIQELVNRCEDIAHSEMNPTQIGQFVNDTNEIVLTVLNEVIQYRQQNVENFTPSETALSLATDYLPWTCANGSDGTGDALLLQHYLTYHYGLKSINQGQLRNSLLDQFVALTDIILDGRKNHLESVKNTAREEILNKQYCSDRHKLINPLLQEKEWEKAGQLAEKYLDFESLVLICELSNNQNRLDEYIEKFYEYGFSEYVYNWYLKENKQGKLIERYRKVGEIKNRHNLSTFLASHDELSWMQHIFDGKFNVAADTLEKLARNEKDSVTKQKTIYSMSKLAKLASLNTTNNDVFIDDINAHLDLITFQEELPDYVLQHFGYDTINPRVIPPKELINLYICPEYSDASELEFKKALDILVFVNDDELRDELCLNIWRMAILRDSWNFKNIDSPMEILQNTLFFKLIEFALVLGADPQNLLPPLDSLMEDSVMTDLQDNKNFQFLMKAAYDHVLRTLIIA